MLSPPRSFRLWSASPPGSPWSPIFGPRFSLSLACNVVDPALPWWGLVGVCSAWHIVSAADGVSWPPYFPQAIFVFLQAFCVRGHLHTQIYCIMRPIAFLQISTIDII